VKKVGLLVLALVMALGLLGAGYAWWTSSIHVSGTVHAANYAYEVTAVGTKTADPSGIGSINVTGPVAGPFVVTIGNISPGFAGNIVFTFKNTGEVPLTLVVGSPSWSPTNELAQVLHDFGTFTASYSGQIAAGDTATATLTFALPGDTYTSTAICGQTVTGSIDINVAQYH
jgi:hypothetical protein